MSSNKPDAKPTILRLVVPKTLANRIITSLTPQAKIQASNLIVETENMSTNDIVRYIKDYTRVRDEILQIIRQYDIPRNATPLLTELRNPSETLSQAQDQLTEVRNRLQQNRTDVDTLDRQIELVKKDAEKIEDMSKTGFQYNELARQMPGYKRILGKTAVKKTATIQKALTVAFQDRVIVAAGSMTHDLQYVLVAIPSESYSQALQIMLQHSLVQMELPEISEDNQEEEIGSVLNKGKQLAVSHSSLTEARDTVRSESGIILNRIVDMMQDSIMILRASLRLGEGTNAALIVARLERPLSPELLGNLSKGTVLEEEIV